MKAKNILSVLLVLFLVGITSCSDDYNDGWYDSIPDGGPFARANTVRFYYIDGEGNSFINPEDYNTFPVTYGEELENPLERTQDFDPEYGYYNGNNNCIRYDEDEGLYYCSFTAYGDSRQSTYSYPLYINGDIDKMEIVYRYTDRDVVGGKYWGKIISWKYNGVHVYSDDDEYDLKVFITKANGKTTVSLNR